MRSVSKASALAALVGGLGWLVPGLAAGAGSPLDQGTISDYGESDTPRSAGMGGALRAVGGGTAGIFLNPAAIATTHVYHIEGMGEYTPETERGLLGAAVIDSVTSRLAGAFAIQGIPLPMDPGGIRRTSLDLRLALAIPLTDRFIVGISGRYLKITQDGEPTAYGFGSSLVSGGLVDLGSTSTPPDRSSLVNTFTFDAGIIFKPNDSIYIAAVGQNLTYANNGFMPLIVGGGVGYSANGLSVEADGLADLSSWSLPGALRRTARLMAGIEYLIGGHVPIRGGFRYDEGAKRSLVSLGTGYVSDQFGVEAAVKRDVSNPGTTSIFLGVAYYLESSGMTNSAPPGGSTLQGPQ
jgi:hypothetical protein